MFISELVGIKSLRQANKRTRTPGGWRKDLEAMGWTPIGSGVMGIVWSNASYPYVLKLFKATDSGYITFLKLAAANQSNPHFPKIRGKLVKLTNLIYAVRLEPLSPVRWDSDIWRSGGLAEICCQVALGRHQPGTKWAKNITKPVAEKYQSLIDAYDQVRRLAIARNFSLDTHAGNIMMRGTVPVITDPLISPGL